MQFFKHYHNASSSISIQKIMKEHGLIGYAQWFLLLELLCEKFDGESDLVSVTVHEVANKLRSKPHLIVQCMARFEGLADIKGNIDNFELLIQCPILLDLQDKDYRYAAKKRRESAENRVSNGAKIKDKRIKNKIKDKEEDKEEIRADLSDPFLNDYLEKVKRKTQDAWLELYKEPEFIKTEVTKAVAWIAENPHKSPKKNIGQFFSNWLSRSWESYRKTKPSTRPTVDSYVSKWGVANE